MRLDISHIPQRATIPHYDTEVYISLAGAFRPTIRLKRIHIEEFRGVSNLDINLAGGNFGICGPNGTGKRGVVDAIEFCLTGDVTRLSGQGTAGLSVKGHAPHVDQRAHPEKANVTITSDIPSRNKTAFGASPWRFGTADYLTAPNEFGLSLGDGAKTTAMWDARLAAALVERGIAVHEEAIVETLLQDLSE